MGDYAILFEEQPTRPMVPAKVKSPYGNVLHRSSRVTQGQFAFTTAKAGMYQACFLTDTTDMVINLNLDWKLGIAAKDWDALAKKEKLEGVALELVKHQLEEAMAEISEWTNSKVTWLSLMSLAVCIIVSYAQLWYLNQFFRKKKLI
ncbi:hypothetical protein BRADI_3g37960v3 [Brachypodium distachyon]|uniref:GOLD domain-containing protein n=1 Tax=Brachypodium distachyon TaxID=15368 RepID=A0A0Q3QA86_BRADI|nr:hypothetical protein BRADI_3g37960v3 [Brachypodium distachyon]